jgi:pimeloyl-ACP methyl ester carboxylesterase
MPRVRTPAIEIEYEEYGSPSGIPVVMLHGFPDSLHTWKPVIAHLIPDAVGTPNDIGAPRILTPHLRGFGGTLTLDSSARTGQSAALAQDVLDFLDALAIERALLVGHDWGSRAACGAAVLAPHRVHSLVILASGYLPVSAPMPYEQAQAYWYQWFFHTPQGEYALAHDPQGLGAYLWRTWSPGWSFSVHEIAEAQSAWGNPDFAVTVLSSYRHRYGNAPGLPQYADQQSRIDAKPPVQVPTVFAAGLADVCSLPQSSIGQESYFPAGYERVELPGIGHFIPREAGKEVALLVRRSLAQLRARAA